MMVVGTLLSDVGSIFLCRYETIGLRPAWIMFSVDAFRKMSSSGWSCAMEFAMNIINKGDIE